MAHAAPLWTEGCSYGAGSAINYVDRIALCTGTTGTTAGCAVMMAPLQQASDAAATRGVRFDQAATRALAAAQPGESVALLCVSLDYFDVLTASHGPDVAQELLLIVSRQIGEIIWPDGETIPHDDGFFILCVPGSGAPDARHVARRIVDTFHQPVMTSMGQLPISVSVGISCASGQECDETTVRMLKREAHSAVVSAQRNGRSQIATFDRAIQQQAIESYETECQMHQALRDERFGVRYQPVVSLHSGQTIGIEATAYWDDEVLGLLSPATFIPIAEEAGLIGELGRLMLQEATIQGSIWNQQDQPAPFVSVNLSGRQLLDPELVPTVSRFLDKSGLSPRQFCFEISESVVMADVAASMTILGYLKDLGLRLAIDNFGTGYSSLSYLRRLPVDILKIDQSFVQSIYNRDDRVITKAIIDLAHTLGMTTVAEGVETRLQVEVLHALNCDMAQGMYLHAPTRADQIDFCHINFEAPSLSENPDFWSASAAKATPYVRQ